MLEGFIVLTSGKYESDDLYMLADARQPYKIKKDAERRARKEARNNPDVKIYVAELVSVSMARQPVHTITIKKEK